MKIHPAEQGSLAWMQARAGVVTASEMDNIFTPEFKVRVGEMRRTYMFQKLAERWFGGPLPGHNTIDMECGKILEEEALPYYEIETGNKITRVGLCLSDSGRIGCSPDGLIGDDGGIEVKCPRAETHMKYLIEGVVPKDYIVQVHGNLLVTGRKYWNFMSYYRRMPMLIVRVERDEKIMEKMKDALSEFIAEMEDDLWPRLCDINGGPPQRKPITQPEPVDVIP